MQTILRKVVSRGGFAACLLFTAGALTARLLEPSAAVAAQPPGAASVCVAADGTMRLATGEGCPAGQHRLVFQEPSSAPAPTCSAEADQLANLERQLADVERDGARGVLGSTVVAPFAVVDRGGHKLFSVESDDQDPSVLYVGAYAGDQRVAVFITDPSGGTIAVRTPSRSFQAVVSARRGENGFAVYEGAVDQNPRLKVGLDSGHAGYALRVMSKAGTLLAGIGESRAVSLTAQGAEGAVVVYDAAGVGRAGMLSQDGTGVVAVRNAKASVARLTEGATHAGLLEIKNASGLTMVEAGMTSDGVGVVRAGPERFAPGAGILGLPSSYIIGKKQ